MSSSIGLQIPWDEIVDSPGKPILSSIIDNVAKYDATRVSKFDIPHLLFHSTQPGTGIVIMLVVRGLGVLSL